MNLVIFNLPEPVHTTETVWDIPEKVEKDIATVKEIVERELKIIIPTGVILDARRLGSNTKNNTDSGNKETPKPRPLKVMFSDIKKKRDILSAAKTLRQSEDAIANKLYINPDLTPEQRKKDQILREEMWRRRSCNNENVIIRRGEIVTAPFDVVKKRTKLPTASSSSA